VATNAVATTAPAGPTTTTTLPEYSFDNSVPPPKLLNTGTDYPAIAESLGQYGNWLGAHRPDPALAARFLAPGSQILLLYSRDLIRLRDNRQRLIEKVRGRGKYVVISARADAVSIRSDELISLQETVDSRGTPTSRVPYAGHSYSRVLLVKVQGRWRVAAWDPEQPPVNVDK
jgi:hypothetical protein